MSGKLNFSGVEEAKDIQMTQPGTIDVFEIKEVEFDTTSKKGTYYMGVSFANVGSSFKHSFFLSEKAMPRVQSLMKVATGTPADGELLEEQIIKMLVGKKLALKVTAKIDTENGRAYPDLPFGGFAKEPSRIGELVFTPAEQKLIDQATEIRENYSSTSGADSEGVGSSAPAASAEAGAGDDSFI